MASRQGKNLPFSPDQLAAARQLLNRMSQEQLAAAADVSAVTIGTFELGQTIPHDRTLEKIKDALERRGITFTNGGAPGVKLDRSKAVIPT
jgi:transcriptional regulator with XRE-family HTH domain